jgi:Tol biopolymer transport system component
MKQKSNLLVAALCLLISVQAAPGQSVETKMPFASDRPILEPKLFAPNEVSTGDYESHPEFTPDGKTVYFLKSTRDFNFWTIVLSRFENGKWTAPQIASFSGQYSDADEFITSDGKRMFFISRRPVSNEISPNAADRLDIWVMDKTSNGAWSEPGNLGVPVNSEASEFFPTLTKDGTLYFGSGRKGGKGGIDLYRSRFVSGRYQGPENLGDAINTEFDEFEPYIAPDEALLIFMAGGRSDGLGGFDLFISYNRDGKWTKAQNLGAPINSAADELSPKITRDGRYFFWTSTRSDFGVTPNKPFASADFFRKLRSPGNGLGDIYYVDVSALKIERAKEARLMTSSEMPNEYHRATGPFEITMSQQPPYDTADGVSLGRVTINKSSTAVD